MNDHLTHSLSHIGIFILLPILTIGCDITQPTTGDITQPTTDATSGAHGYWKATAGDTQISSGPGLIVYNWYAIDTTGHGDSVFVTWDDHFCIRTGALMENNIIQMVVSDVKAEFNIAGEGNASVVFDWNGVSYQKQLKKLRPDPTVFCF